MSETTVTEARVGGEGAHVEGQERSGLHVRVRAADVDDVPAIALGVHELLVELGADPPQLDALEASARELLEDPRAGALLVADAEGAVVGVLGASWQSAMHVPGRYGLIQDLWVHRAWRSRRVGGELVRGLVELARERGIGRIEVGLPRESFAGLAGTAGFYLANGFTTLGTRMRRRVT
jgi:GNAT superfamily N-acetyltransferase